MERILMVDDDKSILDDNRNYFESLGYEVICAETAEEAEKIILGASLDCVILDVDLPGMSGFTLCEKIRQQTGIPLLFLSGYTQEQSRIRGLSIGGDDYVCKPYSLKELELRVRARIRTGRAAEPPKTLHYGNLTINPASRSVKYGKATTDFSTYEFDVLYFLARHPEEVFTYEQIFDSVWKSPINKGLKSLQVIIGRIRKKLLAICPEHDYIQTIRRKGYFFAPNL